MKLSRVQYMRMRVYYYTLRIRGSGCFIASLKARSWINPDFRNKLIALVDTYDKERSAKLLRGE